VYVRILIVTQYFWPENFRINDLAIALKERDHEVTVLTGIPNYPEGKFYKKYHWFWPLKQKYQGVKVLRVPLIPRGKGRHWELVLNYLSFVFFACLLSPFYLLGRRYDIIFTFQTTPITVALPAILLSKLKRAPLLLWVQDLWPESLAAVGAIKSPHLLAWVTKLVSFIYNHSDQILIQSRGFSSNIKALGQPNEKIAYLPNWAESFYHPVALEAVERGVRADVPPGFTILFAGNLGVAQSLETIIDTAEALAGYGDIHWVIVGEGRQREWFIEEVIKRDLSEKIHWIGRRPAEIMPQYFAAADLLLVTLRSDPIFALTIPSKVQSYLACGRPIVAAIDGEGARVIEEAGAGIAVPAEDHEALSKAILELYQESDVRRQKRGEHARRYYLENFSRDACLDKLEQLLKKAKKM
jgi:colanic acid biosynthesis glycosyl transferase WcaI